MQGVFCDVTPCSFDVRYQRFGGKKSQRRHNLEGNCAELLPRETQISLIFRLVSKPKLYFALLYMTVTCICS